MNLITSRLLFIAVLSSFSLSSFSQSDTLFYFFDKKGNSCQSKNAAYVGFGIKEDGHIRFTNYIVPEGLPVMEGHFIDSTLAEKNGYYKSFDPPGYISEEGFYKKNAKEGYWLIWNKNGQVEDSEFYMHGNMMLSIQLTYNQFGMLISRSVDNEVQAKKELTEWNNDGKIKIETSLTQDNGERHIYEDDGTLSSTDIYENGVITKSKYYKKDGSEMSDEEVVTMKNEATERRNRMLKQLADEEAGRPSYPGGSNAFWAYIQENIRIPQSVFNQLPDRTVKVTFMLDEKGHALDIKIHNNGNSDVRRTLFDVLTRMPRWDMKGYKSFGPMTYILTLQGTLTQF